ncbi:MAG: nitroreductase family protein [Phycisphaerales bacterium]|jgi:nitroreductase|nr:nitroreductase family protein [Phycisphaerales bacterium]
MTATPEFIPHQPHMPPGGSLETAEAYRRVMAARRSVRQFSTRPVDFRLIESIIAAAGASPSGANKQPWRFVVVGDADTKRKIRLAAEEEERAFYERRAPNAWLEDLQPLRTGPEKPFLEDAPWLIAVFKLMKDDRADSPNDGVYFVNESVGMATGMLLAAAQHAGLATLTHTPSPMKFLTDLLGRPDYERPYVLIPVGWAADDCEVPNIERKPLDEIMTVYQPDDGDSG